MHDEFEVLQQAVTNATWRRRRTRYLGRIDNGSRFGIGVVALGRRWVLLVGTGMGCTGSSLVVYELGLQRRHVRVIKVGTCVSTYRPCCVGTIFMPDWAIADEGTTRWDGGISRTSQSLPDEVQSVFQGMDAVSTRGNLRAPWMAHMPADLRARVHSSERACVWSSDAFYPLLARPDFVRHLADGHEVSFLDDTQARAAIEAIRQPAQLGLEQGWWPVMAWDMECSALFSAAHVVHVPVAAALVVSWSSSHWVEVGETGSTSRTEADGTIAHDVERRVVVDAVEYLLT